MSGKKTALGARPSRLNAPSPDDWVKQGAEAPPPAIAPQIIEKNKRLTIDIPESLHQSFKVYCAQHGVKMADVVREAIEQRIQV